MINMNYSIEFFLNINCFFIFMIFLNFHKIKKITLKKVIIFFINIVMFLIQYKYNSIGLPNFSTINIKIKKLGQFIFYNLINSIIYIKKKKNRIKIKDKIKQHLIEPRHKIQDIRKYSFFKEANVNIALILSIYVLFLTLILIIHNTMLFPANHQFEIFTGAFLQGFIVINTMIILIFFKYNDNLDKLNLLEQLLLLLFCVSGFISLTKSINYIVLYISIEVASISLYILLNNQNKFTTNIDATLKFIILSLLFSILFLFSASVFYTTSGSIILGIIYHFLKNYDIQEYFFITKNIKQMYHFLIDYIQINIENFQLNEILTNIILDDILNYDTINNHNYFFAYNNNNINNIQNNNNNNIIIEDIEKNYTYENEYEHINDPVRNYINLFNIKDITFVNYKLKNSNTIYLFNKYLQIYINNEKIKEKNIKKKYETEFYFFCKIFSFKYKNQSKIIFKLEKILNLNLNFILNKYYSLIKKNINLYFFFEKNLFNKFNNINKFKNINTIIKFYYFLYLLKNNKNNFISFIFSKININKFRNINNKIKLFYYNYFLNNYNNKFIEILNQKNRNLFLNIHKIKVIYYYYLLKNKNSLTNLIFSKLNILKIEFNKYNNKIKFYNNKIKFYFLLYLYKYNLNSFIYFLLYNKYNSNFTYMRRNNKIIIYFFLVLNMLNNKNKVIFFILNNINKYNSTNIYMKKIKFYFLLYILNKNKNNLFIFLLYNINKNKLKSKNLRISLYYLQYLLNNKKCNYIPFIIFVTNKNIFIKKIINQKILFAFLFHKLRFSNDKVIYYLIQNKTSKFKRLNNRIFFIYFFYLMKKKNNYLLSFLFDNNNILQKINFKIKFFYFHYFLTNNKNKTNDFISFIYHNNKDKTKCEKIYTKIKLFYFHYFLTNNNFISFILYKENINKFQNLKTKIKYYYFYYLINNKNNNILYFIFSNNQINNNKIDINKFKIYLNNYNKKSIIKIKNLYDILNVFTHYKNLYIKQNIINKNFNFIIKTILNDKNVSKYYMIIMLNLTEYKNKYIIYNIKQTTRKLIFFRFILNINEIIDKKYNIEYTFCANIMKKKLISMTNINKLYRNIIFLSFIDNLLYFYTNIIDKKIIIFINNSKYIYTLFKLFKNSIFLDPPLDIQNNFENKNLKIIRYLGNHTMINYNIYSQIFTNCKTNMYKIFIIKLLQNNHFLFDNFYIYFKNKKITKQDYLIYFYLFNFLSLRSIKVFNILKYYNIHFNFLDLFIINNLIKNSNKIKINYIKNLINLKLYPSNIIKINFDNLKNSLKYINNVIILKFFLLPFYNKIYFSNYFLNIYLKNIQNMINYNNYAFFFDENNLYNIEYIDYYEKLKNYTSKIKIQDLKKQICEYLDYQIRTHYNQYRIKEESNFKKILPKLELHLKVKFFVNNRLQFLIYKNFYLLFLKKNNNINIIQFYIIYKKLQIKNLINNFLFYNFKIFNSNNFLYCNKKMINLFLVFFFKYIISINTINGYFIKYFICYYNQYHIFLNKKINQIKIIPTSYITTPIKLNKIMKNSKLFNIKNFNFDNSFYLYKTDLQIILLYIFKYLYNSSFKTIEFKTSKFKILLKLTKYDNLLFNMYTKLLTFNLLMEKKKRFN